MSNTISVCAILAARNEAHYLRFLLPILAEQGIDVAILDNGSMDASSQLYIEHWKNPIIIIEHLPFRGEFSLIEQLEAKQRICERITHDWVIYHNPDEIMESAREGFTLRDTIQEAHDGGYNAINFEEFVFLPDPDSDYFDKNYYKEILRYYFFEPSKNRLNRAWKRTSNFSNLEGAGHTLRGDNLLIFPEHQILRHYIVLGYEHAKRKYLNRVFSSDAIKRGWHKNRLIINERNLSIPLLSKYLVELESFNSKNFRRDRPAPKHYWEW